MSRQSKQTGSAHIVAIAVLVVAVVGLLGYVFWTNFFASTDKDDSVNQPEAAASLELTEKASISRHGVTLSMMYPSDWTLKDPVDDGSEIANPSTLTSRDGDVEIAYGVRAIGPVGGTCGDNTLRYKSTEKLSSSGTLSYSEYISQYEPGSLNISFGLSDQTRAEKLENTDLGNYYCDSFIFNLSGVKTTLPYAGETDVAYYLVGDFPKLQDEAGLVRQDVSFDDARKALDSEEARLAKAIIKSSVVTIE